jgi:thioredoxin 1
MIDEPIHVSDLAFERAVLQAKMPVVVDFWAPWCGPCKIVEPVLKKLAQEYAGKLLVAKVNTEDYPQLTEKYHIQGVPATLFFMKGVEVGRETGAMPEGAYRKKIGQILGVS